MDVLLEYGILDTPPEQEFDDFVLLAAELLHVPISMISLIDGDRQWFKASVGIGARETPIEESFCAYAVSDAATLVVPDATHDARFADFPNVLGDPGIRFYAGAPLINPEGIALGTICVIDREPRRLDATGQRALEALSRQIVSHLELRRSRLRLQEVDRLRDDALALVAHELKNPIHSILAFAEIILDDEESPVTDWQRVGLESIQQSGQRLHVIADDLLLLRQLETANLPLESVEVDLADVVKRALTAASPVAAAAGISLHAEGEQSLVTVADPGRLGQVIDNLIGNALKFTPCGGTVTVVLTRTVDELQLEVSDTGPGIATADLPHLFLPFFRVDAARRAGTPGAGLGLSIAKAIVERHGGSLTVRSSVGRGTTFSVALPLGGASAASA